MDFIFNDIDVSDRELFAIRKFVCCAVRLPIGEVPSTKSDFRKYGRVMHINTDFTWDEIISRPLNYSLDSCSDIIGHLFMGHYIVKYMDTQTM